MISSEIWGKTPCGKDIIRYTLTNAKGASVQLSSMGAGIVSVKVPDRDGKLDAVSKKECVILKRFISSFRLSANINAFSLMKKCRAA